MLRKLLMSLQGVGVVVFVIAMVASYFTQDRIAEDSRQAISDKVVATTRLKVDFAEELVLSRGAEKYLQDYQRDVILEEIARFRTDPDSYVQALVLEGDTDTPVPIATSENPLKQQLLTKIMSWKRSLKAHFEATFDGLLRDIRIFLLTNVLALSAAFFICYKSEALHRKAFAVGAIMTFVITISAVGYLEKNWFYTILLRDYAGYGYPLGIVMGTLWMCYEYLTSEAANSEARCVTEVK